MDISYDAIMAAIEAHRAWAPVIFGLLAFGESMAILGILIPASSIMIACGTLVGSGQLTLAELWIGGSIGGILGDAVSYSLGRWLGPGAVHHWPFARYPQIMARGQAFFRRYGWAAVFFGRFVGPLRAIIPTAAGMMAMPVGLFQLLNVTSAIIWIPIVVAPGALAAWLVTLFRTGEEDWAIGLAIAAVAVAALLWYALKRWGGRLLPKEPPEA